MNEEPKKRVPARRTPPAPKPKTIPEAATRVVAALRHSEGLAEVFAAENKDSLILWQDSIPENLAAWAEQYNRHVIPLGRWIRNGFGPFALIGKRRFDEHPLVADARARGYNVMNGHDVSFIIIVSAWGFLNKEKKYDAATL